VACFVVVTDVQPEIWPEVTRKSGNFFETADCADVTDWRALSLALSEVERAAATAPQILLQRERLLRFFDESFHFNRRKAACAERLWLTLCSQSVSTVVGAAALERKAIAAMVNVAARVIALVYITLSLGVPLLN
jgi:hypothetical protein